MDNLSPAPAVACLWPLPQMRKRGTGRTPGAEAAVEDAPYNLSREANGPDLENVTAPAARGGWGQGEAGSGELESNGWPSCWVDGDVAGGRYCVDALGETRGDGESGRGGAGAGRLSNVTITVCPQEAGWGRSRWGRGRR